MIVTTSFKNSHHTSWMKIEMKARDQIDSIETNSKTCGLCMSNTVDWIN